MLVFKKFTNIIKEEEGKWGKKRSEKSNLR